MGVRQSPGAIAALGPIGAKVSWAEGGSGVAERQHSGWQT